MFFIADLIACSTCLGQHYAHHQESSPQTGHITLSSKPYKQLGNQAPKTTGSNQLYNTLELLMMSIMLPETCWAGSTICNEKHLLHLVGILFPHIVLIELCVKIMVSCPRMILKAFKNLQKAAVNIIMSVHPSTWNNCAPTGWIFMKVDIWGILKYLSIKFKFD